MSERSSPPVRVVLVDDDQAQLDLLGLIVQRQRPQWQVEHQLADSQWLTAVKGDAHDLLGEIALILIDYRLAGGSEVIDLLPLLAAAAPVVIMTGSPNGVDHQACLEAGAAAVVAKPFTIDEAKNLLEVCEQVMSKNKPM